METPSNSSEYKKPEGPYIACDCCQEKTNLSSVNTFNVVYTSQPWLNHAQINCENAKCIKVNIEFYDAIPDKAIAALHKISQPMEVQLCEDERVLEFRREALGIEEITEQQLTEQQESYIVNWGRFLQLKETVVTVEDFKVY